MAAPSGQDASLNETSLTGLHRALGGRLVPFAGYAMPVQFPDGILKEHLHCRQAAGLFDVSHMGQVRLSGAHADRVLESLVVGDIAGLKPQRMRYTVFTNEAGGILDDLMVTRREDHLFLVVNASRKEADLAHMSAAFGDRVEVEYLGDRALMALQGPKATEVLARLAPAAATQPFMSAADLEIDGEPVLVTRSGYTGEDGFELSAEGNAAERIARLLLDQEEVRPIGLGARDSLRLEAGLCLYGHDIDATTTPVEAGLAWTIGKRRRAEGSFPGAEPILAQLADGPSRLRVGIRPRDRAPAREGAAILDADGRTVGQITSGGFGPSVGGPVAMGYVPAALAEPCTALGLEVRGRVLEAEVAALPFVPHRYYRP